MTFKQTHLSDGQERPCTAHPGNCPLTHKKGTNPIPHTVTIDGYRLTETERRHLHILNNQYGIIYYNPTDTYTQNMNHFIDKLLPLRDDPQFTETNPWPGTTIPAQETFEQHILAGVPLNLALNLTLNPTQDPENYYPADLAFKQLIMTFHRNSTNPEFVNALSNYYPRIENQHHRPWTKGPARTDLEAIRLSRPPKHGQTRGLKEAYFMYEYPHRPHQQGPAYIYSDGTEQYYHSGMLHRPWQAGPAVINSDGTMEYFDYGKRHRPAEQGPAVVTRGLGEYWENGVKLGLLDLLKRGIVLGLAGYRK